MSDPITLGLLGAAFAGFVAFAKNLADLREKLLAGRARRSNEAAQYFDDLSKSMSGVVEALRARQVPRIDGNKMNGLIHAFSEKTKGVSLDRSPTALESSLDHAARIAQTLDAYILNNVPKDEAEREQMLRLIERIAGDCGAIATILKKPA
jgi:hypothetical protein